ncbi:hypothetical protein BC834DRAFT_966816 [Gloeopeniophorella convolvens]|nr:hypothetical protein BC834DRAFT_966816 [Gloeopeniophorella convolvens]
MSMTTDKGPRTLSAPVREPSCSLKLSGLSLLMVWPISATAALRHLVVDFTRWSVESPVAPFSILFSDGALQILNNFRFRNRAAHSGAFSDEPGLSPPQCA